MFFTPLASFMATAIQFRQVGSCGGELMGAANAGREERPVPKMLTTEPGATGAVGE
jgi:hypothetical protein